MFNNRATWRVEVTFVETPPSRQLERASGVSQIEVDDHTINCLVLGSFQPFIEALRGHEVICLSSIPAPDSTHLERLRPPHSPTTPKWRGNVIARETGPVPDKASPKTGRKPNAGNG
jgi:hypothetical protein